MQIEPSSPEEADDNEEEEAESVANISPELRLVPRDSEKCVFLSNHGLLAFQRSCLNAMRYE